MGCPCTPLPGCGTRLDTWMPSTLHVGPKTKTMTILLFVFVILAFGLFYKCIEWFEKI
jgi:hypothetical protein